MKSHILQHANDRTEAFRPNTKLDALIRQLKNILSPVQETINQGYATPQKPVVIVVGCPRSGTTFLTQLLVATGAFSYPTNLLSRFAFAPHIGALIQQLLLDPDYDLGNEFTDIRSGKDFSSNVGKTVGALNINEFFHFWRRFFPNHDPGFLNDNELTRVDVNRMRTELASIQAVFKKPFMSKGMMLQYNLSFFTKHMPELKIIHVKRDPLYLMQSICEARLKYYGTDKIWWSVKPREYDYLKGRDPLTQVAGQVLFTDKEITMQTQHLDNSRFITVDYEMVCEGPKTFLKYLSQRFSIPEVTSGIENVDDVYPSGNTRRLAEDILVEVEAKYFELSGLLASGALS